MTTGIRSSEFLRPTIGEKRPVAANLPDSGQDTKRLCGEQTELTGESLECEPEAGPNVARQASWNPGPSFGSDIFSETSFQDFGVLPTGDHNMQCGPLENIQRETLREPFSDSIVASSQPVQLGNRLGSGKIPASK